MSYKLGASKVDKLSIVKILLHASSNNLYTGQGIEDWKILY